MLLSCGVEEDSRESLDCKEIQPVQPKGNEYWIFTAGTDAEAETPILWPPDVNNQLTGKQMLGKIESRRRRGQQRIKWLSPTQWTWAWACSRSWWWTGKSGMLQSMGSQRVWHDWVAELNWTMKYVLCCVMHSHLWLFVTPWAVALQAPLSMEFSRQEYWSGLPFPSPGNLPNTEVELTSLVSSAWAGGFFTNCAKEI